MPEMYSALFKNAIRQIKKAPRGSKVVLVVGERGDRCRAFIIIRKSRRDRIAWRAWRARKTRTTKSVKTRRQLKSKNKRTIGNATSKKGRISEYVKL